MITVLILTVARATAAGSRTFAHIVNHGLAWAMFPDTFHYGACVDCSAARQTAASKRRYAATGRYYR